LTKKILKRSYLILLIITLTLFFLDFRTFWIQTVEAKWLKDRSQLIRYQPTEIKAKRGTIYDRNGNELAYDSEAYTVVAILAQSDPQHIKDPEKVAKVLAPILNMKEEQIISLLNTKNVYQVEIRPGGWKIGPDKAEQIKKQNLEGIFLVEESKRYYPNGDLAANLIGFVNYDNKAVMGVEQYYDDLLKGKNGSIKAEKDRKGYNLPNGAMSVEPAIDGKDIYLTIDKNIQQYVETGLDEAEELYHPEKMVAIVVDPTNGEVLAMANRPNFDPNQYWNIKDFRDYSISYQYEPGSTFKIITLAAAIEEGLFDPKEKYQSGKIKVNGTTIKDHNNGKGWGEITFLEGVQHSSNVAFVILEQRLGKEKLYSYIKDFGFGEKTGIDLIGEENGLLNNVNALTPIDAATMAFGQGVAVTAIQQVMAVSAVANGGLLYQPYILKKIADTETNEVEEKQPTLIRRVIHEETAKNTNEILEKVVDFGERTGYISGYHVAGKTGTAQKIGENGLYKQGKYIVSFIGYAPANDPKLLVYIVIDSPDLPEPYYGSTVAAPIFRDIMQKSLLYYGIRPDLKAETEQNKVNRMLLLPNFNNRLIEEVKNELTKENINYCILGDGKKVYTQFPKEGTAIGKNTTIYLLTEDSNSINMPDLTGKSLREVLEISSILNLKVKIEGNGYVIEQSKPIGDPINHNDLLTIKLSEEKN